MQVSGAAAPSTAAPRRALLRIVRLGAVAALLVMAGGWLLQRARLGATEADARVRVQADVRETFGRMAASLREAADAVSAPALVRAAADEDTAAARQLVAAARSATPTGDDTAEDALTVFAADGTPVAWAGRPSELPPERLTGGDAWFVSRAALGPRLIYVRPVVDGATRVGVIAAEAAIVPADRLAGIVSAGLQAADVPITVDTRVGPALVRLPDEGADPADPETFEIVSPAGDRLLVGVVSDDDIQATRERWRRATASLALLVAAAVLALLAGPLLDWRNRARRAPDYMTATLWTAAAIVAARLTARAASPADWSEAPILSSADYAGAFFPLLLTSPFDFLLTAIAGGGLVALLLYVVDAWRLQAWSERRRAAARSHWSAYALMQLGAGALVAAVLAGHEALLRNTIADSTIDLLHFTLHEWDTARLALQVGLIVAHATSLGLAVAIVRAAQARWSVRRGDWALQAATVACWVLPVVGWRLVRERDITDHLPLVAAAGAVVLLAMHGTRLAARFRHGSQAFRLTLLTLGLIGPAFAFYPTIFQVAWQAKTQLVETRYAPLAMNQHENVQTVLEQSLGQIDRIPDLRDLAAPGAPAADTLTDAAFQIWRTTALAMFPVTSSVELFGADGRLVSRFAFNLPEDRMQAPLSSEGSCDWQQFGEVNPFFAEERRILHAGRRLCDAQGRTLGAIAVHAMLTDYENLPFIPSRSPYVELLRAPEPLQRSGFAGRDVEYAVYGWSRTPLYASAETAWPLTDDVFARLVDSRDPLWAELERGASEYDVYLLNDRGGIYALGFPVVSALDHLVHLAELALLAVLTCVLLLAGNAAFGALSRRGTTAPALLREIRASFSRKLFIAFVAAVFVPVVALAVVARLYVADRLRTSVEAEAVRTASAAGRVLEDLVASSEADDGVVIDDNLLVWVSRLIDQDVNIFSEGRLLATSERNLFASGFLPTRTPAELYEALQLRREAAAVISERVGALNPYLVAGTRIERGIVTVPLTSRQQEIEAEIENLDRRVLLGAVFFVCIGSFIAYWFAERISDPVNRLTRATRRIARGDLDARIAATSSDELRRLVEDFNSMARDLQRQRADLERTNRLEAWAEMARQVAHEIKNPLTPIQLNAEHLRRVHRDRGEPLSPVLQECVETILTQVKLLRQIASEFSSFASSPTARPSAVDVPELLHEVIDPYRAGLAGRIRIDLDIGGPLPPVHADRTLISRSLTNIVENALAAMPGGGTLAVTARADDHRVRIRVSDTGVGMDAEALARAFEPYFSTKAAGTGLGLPIAKRNVELTGGTIAIDSERDRGTMVELTLPVAAIGV